jgi:hypothetical protein
VCEWEHADTASTTTSQIHFQSTLFLKKHTEADYTEKLVEFSLHIHTDDAECARWSLDLASLLSAEVDSEQAIQLTGRQPQSAGQPAPTLHLVCMHNSVEKKTHSRRGSRIIGRSSSSSSVVSASATGADALATSTSSSSLHSLNGSSGGGGGGSGSSSAQGSHGDESSGSAGSAGAASKHRRTKSWRKSLTSLLGHRRESNNQLSAEIETQTARVNQLIGDLILAQQQQQQQHENSFEGTVNGSASADGGAPASLDMYAALYLELSKIMSGDKEDDVILLQVGLR